MASSRSALQPEAGGSRRRVLVGACAGWPAAQAWSAADGDGAALLRTGGHPPLSKEASLILVKAGQQDPQSSTA